MALDLKLPSFKKSDKGKKINKKKIPSKQHINALIRNKKKFSAKKNLPLLILVGLLLMAFCKFMVVDRILYITEESDKLSEIQMELTQVNQKIDKMKDLEDVYAHYTTSDMTEDELERVDRVEAMKMVDNAFRDGNSTQSWNLTGNIMTLQVKSSALKKLNKLALELEKEPIVERCVISSADKHTEKNGDVVVTFTIYLQQPKEAE